MLTRSYTFLDPDDYQMQIRAGQVEIMTSTPGDFAAGLTRLDFGCLWMQQGFDSLPRIARMTLAPERAIVTFTADRTQAPIQLDGKPVAADCLTFFRKGATAVERTEAGNRWSSMSLTHEDLALASRAILGRELACPADTRLVRPPREAMARLMNLHGAAVAASRHTPEILESRESARALEGALIHAMVTCLADGGAAEGTTRSHHYARMIARFDDYLESRSGEPVYLAEMCAAVGTSERTLRSCCHEVLGVGPLRYLWLRRMHLARKALLRADPATATVTDIATGQGFWELGRFSVEYKALFGERPSQTLRCREIASAEFA